MQLKNTVIALTGESGDGVISLGELLTRILASTGMDIMTFRTYPAEVRGGQCIFTINANRERVYSQGDEFDILLCMDTKSYLLNSERLKDDGILLLNLDSPGADKIKKKYYGIPIRTLAEQINASGSKNVIILGVIVNLFGLSLEVAKNIITNKWGSKEEVLKKNLDALEAGWTWSAKNLVKDDNYIFEPFRIQSRMLVSGNEALCLGAIAANCKFFAGYPITPATDMLEWFMSNMPKFGGVALQTEDEISAFGAALGASYSGVRALTATSGPGFSLMTEFVNLAGAAEVPLVIIDVQRAGPSTGMPTKTDQADLNHAALGGSGESPRLVVAPIDVEDGFYQIIKAFNLADKFQLPVILLSDQSLSHRYETVPKLDSKRTPIIRPKRPTNEELKHYKRYIRTEDGVSPMSIPGMVGGTYVATGLERDEIGMPDYNPVTHELNTLKRQRKLERAAEEDAEFETFGVADAGLGVISWGSTTGAVREAVQIANKRGLKVCSLHPKLLYPVPKSQIANWISLRDDIIVVEVNQYGQYHHLLQGEFGKIFHYYRRSTGLPIASGEILAKIREVIGIGG